ncbi:DUF4879 domain-containing protein [Gynuella sunshinyii]|uniref:Uncharacterized protein n=1 Tax=Gynuella sunshinyii YC6258 TaxID=1445510 RepID=A0A0C5VML8_9GAMM|nr:hypothetical Protein YC6258_03525 [Gynuella sunshinyii YC6258]
MLPARFSVCCHPASLSITLCDYGGSQLRAAVLEIGYGHSEFAWMNGSLLPNSAQYSNTRCAYNGWLLYLALHSRLDGCWFLEGI